MTALQRTSIGILWVALLFISTLFRSELFVTTSVGVLLFKFLVVGQFLLPIFLFAPKGAASQCALVGVLVLVELTIWAYGRYLANTQHHYVRGRRFIQEVMDGWDKNLIQFDPQLSQYDSTLFYTLKPSITDIPFKTGFEINTPIRTNSLGVRDDETSLDNPAVIFLGDSFTMGWGVTDSACFTSIMERKLGVKTLNAGISSFGTARESAIFKRIRRDSCRVLVLQYCLNDQDENAQMAAGTFAPSALDKYESATRYNSLTADYYPFKYLYAVLKLGVQKVRVWQASYSNERRKSTEVVPSTISYEEAFFAVVRHIRKEYTGPIVITCLNPEVTTSETIRNFQSYLKRFPMSEIYLADVSDVLTPEDYFTLDNHINSGGHRKVAERLVAVICKNQLLD